ncbi:uncharacterized protein LOC133417641 isoform X7 [Phycodurus eques]|uniref:uncharacterized protein LOC133417641 isoform X7 n=1 Tax=Phycodurus eques TaxID=693459 RepID=UPI002ACD3340|nr:uncharacterized protein LOC133417641 isoform X7 [Phycodurus eques]
MGSGESKLDFRKAVIHLTSTTQPVEASDDVFWEQFWADPSTSVQDIFALVPAAEIRALREESPSNLATLCYKAVEKLGRAAVRGCPSERERAAVLNCARLLTRVLPFIYEDADWRGFFWSSLPGAQNQEAVAVADTVDSCELIWEAGVGFAQSPAPNSAHDSNRAELLKLLLTCFSEVLYLAPTDHHVNPWVLFFCSASNRHALPLFTSLLNVVCAYDPSGSGFPYNHLLFSDRRQILVVQALQVLIVTLERRGPRAAPAADALHASAPSAGDETDWARKPVCQLPVQDPPRRGLELHPERSEPAPQQPSGADLPAKLCQEDLLPPGDPHPLLEALRLQQEIPLLRAEEQRRSGRAGPHPVFPQRSPRRSVCSWRGAGPHGRLHPASAERREELWRAPQQTLHAARPHGRPRLQRDTRRPAARDLPQDDDLRTSASAAALRLSAHRRRQRFCTFWRFSPRRGSFSRPRATTSSSSSCWRSSTTSSSTSLTVTATWSTPLSGGGTFSSVWPTSGPTRRPSTRLCCTRRRRRRKRTPAPPRVTGPTRNPARDPDRASRRPPRAQGSARSPRSLERVTAARPSRTPRRPPWTAPATLSPTQRGTARTSRRRAKPQLAFPAPRRLRPPGPPRRTGCCRGSPNFLCRPSCDFCRFWSLRWRRSASTRL